MRIAYKISFTPDTDLDERVAVTKWLSENGYEQKIMNHSRRNTSVNLSCVDQIDYILVMLDTQSEVNKFKEDAKSVILNKFRIEDISQGIQFIFDK